MELAGDNIILDADSTDGSICSTAYFAHSPTRQIKNFNSGSFTIVSEEDTRRILQGLANISLQEVGDDYHGLTQIEADRIIQELFGDSGAG